MLKIWFYTVLLLFPLVLRGQQSTWGDAKLREKALSVSSGLPYAIAVYDFAERYLTMLDSLPVAERRSRMERDDVRITEGGIDRLSLLNKGTSLGFAERDNRYFVSFSNDDYPLISLSLPASCQVILGKNLKQLEAAFIEGLSSYKPTADVKTSVTMEELKPLQGNFYLLQGESYQIEEINDNRYYEADGGKNPKLVFGMEHPAESVFNLLLSADAFSDVRMELTIRQYGLKKEQISLPLHQWMSYVHSQGCRLYVGIEALETKVVKATLFAVNDVLKYNHVMNVVIPYTLLYNKEGHVRGDVNLFIPTHNIAALFDELNWVEPPVKKQIEIE